MGAKQKSHTPNLAAQVAILSDLLSDRVEQSLRNEGASLSTFQLLSTIKSAGPKVSQIELAQRLGVTAASLCEGIKLATARGFVVQKPSETDKRAKRVLLTPKGETLIRETLATLDNENRLMLQGFENSELSAMEAALKRCIENLSRGKRG